MVVSPSMLVLTFGEAVAVVFSDGASRVVAAALEVVAAALAGAGLKAVCVRVGGLIFFSLVLAKGATAVV